MRRRWATRTSRWTTPKTTLVDTQMDDLPPSSKYHPMASPKKRTAKPMAAIMAAV
jgi:hypothetical protein